CLLLWFYRYLVRSSSPAPEASIPSLPLPAFFLRCVVPPSLSPPGLLPAPRVTQPSDLFLLAGARGWERRDGAATCRSMTATTVTERVDRRGHNKAEQRRPERSSAAAARGKEEGRARDAAGSAGGGDGEGGASAYLP
ncbi:unnamed protein product, partial [Urochloa humidicola]